jgi:hypothetical protein
MENSFSFILSFVTSFWPLLRFGPAAIVCCLTLVSRPGPLRDLRHRWPIPPVAQSASPAQASGPTRSCSPGSPHACRRRPLSPTGGTRASSPTSRRLRAGIRAAARVRPAHALLHVALTAGGALRPYLSHRLTRSAPHPKP